MFFYGNLTSMNFHMIFYLLFTSFKHLMIKQNLHVFYKQQKVLLKVHRFRLTMCHDFFLYNKNIFSPKSRNLPITNRNDIALNYGLFLKSFGSL